MKVTVNKHSSKEYAPTQFALVTAGIVVHSSNVTYILEQLNDPV